MYPLIHAEKTNAFRLQCHFFQFKGRFRVWLCEDVRGVAHLDGPPKQFAILWVAQFILPM